MAVQNVSYLERLVLQAAHVGGQGLLLPAGQLKVGLPGKGLQQRSMGKVAGSLVSTTSGENWPITPGP